MLKKMGLLSTGLMIVLLVALACNSKSPSDLSYTAPFEIGITAGNFLPGTELQYMGVADGMAQVYIKGQRALKQKADSLSWEGEVREGVLLELDLRALWFDESTLHVGGTGKVEIKGASAQAAALPGTAALTFDNAPVAYTVKKGVAIPGTLLTYEGKTDEGAKFGGTDDYPYRKDGDSIVWTGTLKDKVWLDLDLRVGIYTDRSLTVAGLASVWVEP